MVRFKWVLIIDNLVANIHFTKNASSAGSKLKIRVLSVEKWWNRLSNRKLEEQWKNENGLYFESLVIEVRFDYNYLMKLMPLWNLGLIGMPSGTNFQLSDYWWSRQSHRRQNYRFLAQMFKTVRCFLQITVAQTVAKTYSNT